ncbi:DUF423 domain-containing protein [Roseibium sp. FZY0029]|uniref:DUF423 domain-containing protein n=1 Tax=Roseibium sp. FZY0029 TaxID=3116647 RepID=UPI002ECCC4D0|nr:DUF423 domain-containing protein [Roseibium sp. FZY0029]
MQPQATPTAPMLRVGLILSGIIGAGGVVSLALSAHANASNLIETAAQMLLFHAPVILGIGLLGQVRRVPLLPAVLVLLAAGLTLFCGDLLMRAFLERRLFPMSAPIGGMMVILGWLVLALCALRVRPK